jgi:hypothetical protein
MTPGFGAGLIIPDLWQQEAVRALQRGKDPPLPRLRRDKRRGAGAAFVMELSFDRARNCNRVEENN